jgi:HSP20 family protein
MTEPQLVRVEMPGVKPEDVHVAVHNRVLTISGERKVEEEERAGYYVRELRHGSFQRSMILPEGVDEEEIRARSQDGILEVALEGAAAAREPKSIQIEVPPGGQQSATDVEVGELGTEASTPTTESARPGATLPGDAPPEAPPEPPPR